MDKEDKKKSTNASDADMVQVPARFARELIKQVIYKPWKVAAQEPHAYDLYKKEDIIKWLQNPKYNERNLRNASNYMYLSSMHYQRLIKYYAGLMIGAYVVSPLSFNPETAKPESFAKQYRKVSSWLQKIKIPSLIREILIVALRDGAYYGVRWQDTNSSFTQKLEPDYCKITSVSNGSFLYSVDMSRLTNRLEFYPAEFTEMYANYLATGQRWQEVPEEISVCVKADPTNLNCTIPPFSAVMPSLYTIANREALEDTAKELKNYELIAGHAPVDDDGNPIMDYDLFLKYYDHLVNSVGENVGVAVTPFDLEQFTFGDRTGTSQVNDIADAVDNFWATAGTSSLLHGVNNSTSGVTKLAIKNDETFVMDIVYQIENIINRCLKTEFSTSVKFKISILPVTVFNKDEYIKQYKEAAAFGIGKSYYAASLGIPQEDMAGLNYLEDTVMSFDKLKPLQSSYNTSTDDTGAGRPMEEDETNLSPEGENTRENDTNANR